jgi:cytochrome c-type biogenesis protein CcmE
MSTKSIRIAATAAVIALALGGLFYTTLSEGTEYYKHVDEVMSDPGAWQGKRLQLHGFVTDVRRRPDSLDYRFQVGNKGVIVGASYTGVVPDTFKDDSEVVLTGQLTDQGFMAKDMTAKCPSKYEEAPAVGASQ